MTDRYICVAAALLVAISVCCASSAIADVQSVTIKGEVKVFDGDTLEIGPMLIRLHGVDAPEKAQRCAMESGARWNCGAAASAFFGDFTGRTARCIGEGDAGWGYASP